MRGTVVALLSVAAVCSGCSEKDSGGSRAYPPSDEPPLSLRCSDKPSGEGLACVRGSLVAQLGPQEGLNRWIGVFGRAEPYTGVRMCSAVLPSLPPLCGGDSVEVRGLDPRTVPALAGWIYFGAMRIWSEKPLSVRGGLRENVLSVPPEIAETYSTP
jgi:hypothetical protein